MRHFTVLRAGSLYLVDKPTALSALRITPGAADLLRAAKF